MIRKVTYCIIFSFLVMAGNAREYSILDFGAKPDGSSNNTLAIQQAIDECSKGGGGTVIFPAGVYMSGTIFLKSNVSVYLEKACVIKGIGSDDVYPLPENGRKGFIRIDNVENVTIMGEGTIDGNGNHPVFRKGDNGEFRPFLMECVGSKNIVIKDIHLYNSACWTLHISGSEYVRIDGLKIYSHTNWNNDGIDIDSKNVIISNCNIDSDDDAICFKSEGKSICENVVVTNCVLASNCNLIKFGTGSVKGFRNIAISNCCLHAASESNFRNWNKHIAGVTDSITGIAGIALEMVDGGMMDQITINNITMTGVQTPVFMRLGSRKNPTGSMKNILLSNITANSRSQISSCISGVPGFYIENVIIRDLLVTCMGGGAQTQKDEKAPVPENEKAYPENRMFGNSLPAYGLYVRHARNICLDNVQFNLSNPDYRPALLFEDAQKITIRGFTAPKSERGQSLIVKQRSKIKIFD